MSHLDELKLLLIKDGFWTLELLEIVLTYIGKFEWKLIDAIAFDPLPRAASLAVSGDSVFMFGSCFGRIINLKSRLHRKIHTTSYIEALAVVSETRIVFIRGSAIVHYDVEQRKEIKTFTTTSRVCCLAASDQVVLSLHEDCMLDVWNDDLVRSMKADRVGWFELCLSADSRFAATKAQPNHIHLWTVATGECMHIATPHDQRLHDLAFTNNTLLSRWTNQICVWDTSGRCLIDVQLNFTLNTNATFNGDRIMFGSVDRLHEYNVYTGQITSQPLGLWGSMLSLDDGRLVVVVENKLLVFA